MKKPHKLRKMTGKQEKEILELFHFYGGAEPIIEDLEDLFQEALIAAEESGAQLTSEFSQGYYQIRNLSRLLRYLDPYRKE